jgi:hypothetical protein
LNNKRSNVRKKFNRSTERQLCQADVTGSTCFKPIRYYDFRKYKGEQSTTKMARNLVDYEAGKTIFQTALGIMERSNIKQNSLFGDEW